MKDKDSITSSKEISYSLVSIEVDSIIQIKERRTQECWDNMGSEQKYDTGRRGK